MTKKKDLKSRVDSELEKMLDAVEEPSEGRMKLLNIAIKKLALDAKLEESTYGDFFNDDPSGTQKQQAGQKPGTGIN